MDQIVIAEQKYSIVNLPGRPPAMLDRDVAKIYEVTTREINQAKTRNPEKFPSDFLYQLDHIEAESLISQDVILNSKEFNRGNPWCYTWEGCNMLATILKSDVATRRAIEIVRGFTNIERDSSVQTEDIYKEHPLMVMTRNFLKVEKEQQVHKEKIHDLAIKSVRHELEQKMLSDKIAIQERQLKEEKRLRTKSLEEIKAKTDAVLSQTGYFSIIAFANIKGIKLPNNIASYLGKKASALSRVIKLKIGEVPDARHGHVGSYHESILKIMFKQEGLLDNYKSN